MNPRLLCVCGPNGAGKSTFTRALALRANIIVIDPDKLAAEGLSPIAAGKAAVRLTRHILAEGVSFARESTLTARFDFSLMEEARAHGYRIELVYIRLASPELALHRVAARVRRGGHDVPEQDVLRRYERSLANLPRAESLADVVTILDNSHGLYRRIR